MKYPIYVVCGACGVRAGAAFLDVGNAVQATAEGAGTARRELDAGCPRCGVEWARFHAGDEFLVGIAAALVPDRRLRVQNAAPYTFHAGAGRA